MSRGYKIVLAIFLLLLAGLVFLEANQPEPINWSPSYANTDKIPLGSYVFYESLQEKYPQNLHKIKNAPFQFLRDTTVHGTYFFLNRYFAFGKAELDRILEWTAEGNTLFISAKSLGQKLLDTLQLETSNTFLYDTWKSQPLLNFVNPKLKSDSAYYYAHDTSLYYFSEIDTASNVVLGVTNLFQDNRKIEEPLVNFIKVPFGEGEIYLHLFPAAFGNYFMLLQENYEYAEKVMAYIDMKKPLFWDGYYKIGKPVQMSPLYILLGNKYLKWAYYFVLIGGVLFVFFEGKRKQKSIAVVEPLKNKTHDFTQTVSGMYLEEKQHGAIARKQITLFLDYIRSSWRVDTQKLDENFLKTLAEKSGNSLEKTRELFHFIDEVQQKNHLDKEALKKLTKLIQKYKNKA